MTTSIQGTRLDLTADVRRQVDAALAAALRSLGEETSAVHAAVEVERTTTVYRAEVTLSLGRATLRAEATADSLRQALGDVRQMLARQVREWRARRRDARRTAAPSLSEVHVDDRGDET